MPENASHGLLTADGRQPVVLVVDSNRSTAAVATMLAEQFGCQAMATSSADRAIGILRGERAIDLVLIDFGISDMSPLVTARLIRTFDSRQATPLVAIGDGADRQAPERERGLFAGAVTKPYSPRELFAALEKSLGTTSQKLTAQ